MADPAKIRESLSKIHKAAPADDEAHCVTCGQRARRVPGGHGTVWVHSDSGAVVAPNPPVLTQEQVDAAYKWADDFMRDHMRPGEGDA